MSQPRPYILFAALTALFGVAGFAIGGSAGMAMARGAPGARGPLGLAGGRQRLPAC